MGESLKVLGQVTPLAATLTTLYTVPSSFSAVVSSITICNLNSSITANFRVSIAQGGAADSPAQYIYFDLPILPNDTFIATIGVSLAMNDVVRVYSNDTNVAFNLLGVEVGAFPPPPANLAGGDLSGFYPNPTVVGLQNNDVYPDILGPSEDGYVLAWDNTDGYWKATPDIDTSASSAVIFDGGTPSANIRSDRLVDQSPINNTQEGIVNLSSDTTGLTTGATANFTTISGGDQNVIGNTFGTISGGLQNTVSASFGTIGGGTGNTVSGPSGTVVGGQNNTAGAQWSTAGGQTNGANGIGSTSFGNSCAAVGQYAATLSSGNTVASGDYSIGLGWNTWAARFGSIALNSSVSLNGNIGSSQSGQVVFATKQTTAGTAFVITDFNGNEFDIDTDNQVRYFSMQVRILVTSSNADTIPAHWIYEVLFHKNASAHSVVDDAHLIYSSVGVPAWNTTITASGTDTLIHITVDPTTDNTNVLYAVADLKWTSTVGFNT